MLADFYLVLASWIFFLIANGDLNPLIVLKWAFSIFLGDKTFLTISGAPLLGLNKAGCF